MADRQTTRFVADVLTFGWVLPAAIATGAGLGWLLDRLLGSFPAATIVGGLLGFAAGVWQLWREMQALAAQARDGGDEGPPGDGAP